MILNNAEGIQVFIVIRKPVDYEDQKHIPV